MLFYIVFKPTYLIIWQYLGFFIVKTITGLNKLMCFCTFWFEFVEMSLILITWEQIQGIKFERDVSL